MNILRIRFTKNIISIITILVLMEAGLWAECKRPLSISFTDQWEPYQYRDSSGKLTGLDIELIEVIMKNAGCELKILLNVPWKRHLINVEQGLIDLAPDASKTEEREKYAYFSDPYRSEIVALYVKKGDSNKYSINSLSDLVGKKFNIGILRGSYYGEEFNSLMKNAGFSKWVKSVNKTKQNFKMLEKNRIHGFLGFPPADDLLIKNEGFENKIERHPMPFISTGDVHLMFSRKSTSRKIVDEFDTSLKDLKKKGIFQNIIKKYLNR